MSAACARLCGRQADTDPVDGLGPTDNTCTQPKMVRSRLRMFDYMAPGVLQGGVADHLQYYFHRTVVYAIKVRGNEANRHN